MLTLKDLKAKYQELTREEKEIVGTALVKVNLGVSTPQELRRVAAFLKGSQFIAKAELLDKVIEYIHHDDSAGSDKTKEPTEAIVSSSFSESTLRRMSHFPEDSVVTANERLDSAKDEKK